MQNFQELDVWKRAHLLVLRVYKASKDLPQSENFGLILNLRRSVTNMTTRIAEGAGRASEAEFVMELKRARATGYELEYLLLVCRDLNFMDIQTHETLSEEVIVVRKMLSGLLRTINSSP